MSRNRLTIFYTLCLLAGVIAGCRQEDPPASGPASAQRPVVSVRATTVPSEAALSRNEVAGTIEAATQAVISAKVTGIIEELPATLGAPVKKGEVLVRVRGGEIAARVAQARTARDQARRNLDREKRLLAESAATRETVRTLTEAWEIAEAAYDEANALLSHTVVTAPFDALVAKKMANQGDLATPGAPLLELTDNRRLRAVFPVPESLLPKVRPGDELVIKVPGAGLETVGRVTEIAPVADARSRTAVVKIELPAAAGLLPGQFARVILPGTTTTLLLAPAEAVFPYGQLERIFVLEDSRARLRLVRTGAHRQGQVEILSGLTPGETVIVESSEPLIDGQPVQVRQ